MYLNSTLFASNPKKTLKSELSKSQNNFSWILEKIYTTQNTSNYFAVDCSLFKEIEERLSSLEKIVYELALDQNLGEKYNLRNVVEFFKNILEILQNVTFKLEELNKTNEYSSKALQLQNYNSSYEQAKQIYTIIQRIKNLTYIIDLKLKKMTNENR